MSGLTPPSAAGQARRAQLESALAAAEASARAERRLSRAHATQVELLAALGRRADAVAALTVAWTCPPGDAPSNEALGFAAFALNEHEIARQCYDRVVALAPNDATAWYNLATAQRNLGALEAAEAACERALALDPKMATAALLRSHVRTQRPDRNHVEDLRRLLESAGAAPGTQIFLNYALGKELDDLGEFAAAFRHFSAGARARRAALHYDVDQDIAKLRRIQETYAAERLAAASFGEGPRGYGFILGLPRSGTTLIERVLTGHPAVRSNGETDNVMSALMDSVADGGGDIFERAAACDGRLVARAYQRRAGPPPPGGLLLEKLPLNYLYAGAIRLAMPRAPIVLVTRSPADNGFAMYSTLFGSGYPFSYDLAELARYLRAYRDLIDHWRRTLGDQMLEVSYESFIAEPARLGAQLARHVGVAWADDMVKIENNRTASATASAAQIRRPIYTSAAGRWRNYATDLAPFLDALQAVGVDPGDPSQDSPR